MSISLKATRAWEDQYAVARWIATPVGKRFIMAHIAVSKEATVERLGTRPPNVDAGTWVTALLTNSLLHGRTIFVSSEMSELAEQSLEDFGDVPLTKDMMPSPDGWMWLEQSFTIGTYNTDFMYRIRAVHWMTRGDDVIITLWSDMSEKDSFTTGEDNACDGMLYAVAAELPGYSLFDFSYLVLGHKVVRPIPPGKLQARDERYKDMTDDEVAVFARENLRPLRIVQVLWALCQQGVREPSTPKKHARKRVRRMLDEWMSEEDLKRHLLAQESTVHVMTLGREYAPDSSGSSAPGEVRYTHRWLVRPFWRWHWYGGKDRADDVCEHCGKTGGVHRRILIPPHVKGPADAPLIEKNRVDVLKP